MHTIKQNLVHKKIKTFKNKKILITEQERFKGSWFFLWLSVLESKLIVITLHNKKDNNHFNLIKDRKLVRSYKDFLKKSFKN